MLMHNDRRLGVGITGFLKRANIRNGPLSSELSAAQFDACESPPSHR